MKLILSVCICIICLYPKFGMAVECPSINKLATNKEWVVHTWRPKSIQGLFEKHLTTPLAPIKVPLHRIAVLVNVNRGMGKTKWSEIVWVIQRSYMKTTDINGKPSCYVMGSVAFYVELQNKNGWPPEVNFKSKSERKLINQEQLALIELRWFDPLENKRHQWYNQKLATFIQWVEPESPIQLPTPINCLY